MSIWPYLNTAQPYPRDTVTTHEPQTWTYWVQVFEKHEPSLLRRCDEVMARFPDGHAKVQGFANEYRAYLEHLHASVKPGDMAVFDICEEREDMLRKWGIADPYAMIKSMENDAALQMLREHLKWLDAHELNLRLRETMAGVFAGNLFDLGASSTTAMFEAGEFDFHGLQDKLANQTWPIDDSDAFFEQWKNQPWHKAIVFVDNAGADLILGMLPLIRELLRSGTDIVIAANGEPSLNDITIQELRLVVNHMASWDPICNAALTRRKISMVDSGCRTPEIDLTCVTDELVELAHDADLMILEGMGRAVESNWNAIFDIDALHLATIKEPWLADRIGVNQYDPVCRFKAIDR